MNKLSLKLVVATLGIVYVLAGVLCVIEFHRQETLQMLWALLAVFCVFLAGGVWRLNRMARTISVTLLWAVVLVSTYNAIQPLYFSELGNIVEIPGLQNRSDIYFFIVALALVALRILGKHKMEFH